MRLPSRPPCLVKLAGPLLVLGMLAVPPHGARAQDAPAEPAQTRDAQTRDAQPAEHRPTQPATSGLAEPRRAALDADAPAGHAGAPAAQADASARAPHAATAATGEPAALATLRAALQPHAPAGPAHAPGEPRPMPVAARIPAVAGARTVPLAPVRPISAATAPGLVAHGAPLPGSLLGTPALPAVPLPAGPVVAPPLEPSQVEAEVGRLRAAMAAEVPGSLRPAPDMARHWIALLRPMLAGPNAPTHPQLVVVVDRNTRVQQAALVMVRPSGPWEVIGATHVSTGQAGRWDHYITPVGVFPHTDLILDYRAEGTYNENHIRGLGVKGMRVWDFGWQWAHRGWGEDGSPIQIRMEMHATDPAVLAQRIGHTASQGCIRIPEALNRFLDRRGVLDADYERAAVDDIRYRALLPKDRVPTTLAGDTLVVVDSSGAT